MAIPANAKAIYTFLVSHGLNANAAAGITGNIEQESGGNPGAGVWPNNWGLIQWTPANHYFSGPTTNLQTQLNAILAYIKANGSIAAINAHSPNPSAAALYFSTQYERPNAALANNANRQSSAIAVANAAKSGKWTAGTPTTGSHSGGSMATTPAGSHTSAATVPADTPAVTTSFPGGSADPLNWGSEIANALNPANWFKSVFSADILKRLGLIVLGGLLVIVGVWILAGRQVETAAGAVIPK